MYGGCQIRSLACKYIEGRGGSHVKSKCVSACGHFIAEHLLVRPHYVFFFGVISIYVCACSLSCGEGEFVFGLICQLICHIDVKWTTTSTDDIMALLKIMIR